MNAAEQITAVDPTDTPAIRRAKARLAEVPGSEESGPSGRQDLDAAGRGTVEHAILLGLYQAIDRRNDSRVRELMAAKAAENAQRLENHRRAKPARWAALSDAQRLCYQLASEDVSWPIRTLLIRAAALLGHDLTEKTPPSAFEPEH